jgi:hypothetical protein
MEVTYQCAATARKAAVLLVRSASVGAKRIIPVMGG